MKRILLAAAFSAAMLSHALAASGQFPSGYVQGNSGASAGQGVPSSISSIFDRALGTTANGFPARISGMWAQAAFGSSFSFSGSTINLNAAGATTLGGVNSFTCATHQWASVLSTLGAFTCSQPAIGDISGWGTGVAAALGVNIGFAGAPVLFNGAGGTPSSLTLTNATGLPFGGLPSGSLDTVLGYFGATTLNAIAVNNCSNSLTYSTTTHTFGCNTGTVTNLSAGTGITFSSGANCTTTCTVNGLRGASAANLYVSTTGSDSNNCLSAGSPCLTIQHAVALGQTYDLQGAALTINLAAGTYTKGVFVSGIIPGQVNGTGAAPMIKIVGAGSGSTTIDPSSNCGSGSSAIYISDGATVGVGGVKLQTSCSGGDDFAIVNGAIGFLANGDVNFGAANNALIYVLSAKFDANYSGSFGFTISGGGTYGIAASTHGIVVTGVGAGITNTISGTPSFSAEFLSLADGSFYNEGINSSWANPANASGTKYAIFGNSHIDREQILGSLPGSTAGTVQGLSIYYDNPSSGHDLPCVGGSGGCRIATAPTGLGTGGTATMYAGSGDHSGAVQLNFGTGPGTSGSVVVAQVSILTGDYGGGGFCTVSLNDNNATWPSGSMVQSYYSSGIVINWSGSVSPSATYLINYVCS